MTTIRIFGALVLALCIGASVMRTTQQWVSIAPRPLPWKEHSRSLNGPTPIRGSN
jgi:hypothetical protein